MTVFFKYVFWKEISPAKIVQYTPKNISSYHCSTKMLLFVPNKWTRTELFGKRRSSKAASKGCNSYAEFWISLKFRTQFIFQSIIIIFGYLTSKLSIFVFKSEKNVLKNTWKTPFLNLCKLDSVARGQKLSKQSKFNLNWNMNHNIVSKTSYASCNSAIDWLSLPKIVKLQFF